PRRALAVLAPHRRPPGDVGDDHLAPAGPGERDCGSERLRGRRREVGRDENLLERGHGFSSTSWFGAGIAAAGFGGPAGRRSRSRRETSASRSILPVSGWVTSDTAQSAR